MSIDYRKFVNIISGVGGSAGVRALDLITRVFTQNPRLDPNSVYEFTNATDVGTFFGTTSLEYLRALFYFGWISPLIGAADKISYARGAVTAALGAFIYGGQDVKSLAVFNAITTGKLLFVIDGVQVEVPVPTLAGAASLAAVATVIQTALIASGNTALTGCTVTYDPTRNSFVFNAAVAGTGTNISVIADTTATAGTDLSAPLEWTQSLGALNVGKAAVQSTLQAITTSLGVSNNCYSIIAPLEVTLSNILTIAEYLATFNNKFIYEVSVTPANAAAWSAALLGTAGIALTLPSPAGTVSPEFPEMIPGIIVAATDYTKINSVMASMYKQFAVTPSVADTPTSNAMDALRVNYYGNTQINGQSISFYQRGTLTGGATSPTDQNVFANEAWLKSQITADLMSLQLSVGEIPADVTGEGMVQSVLAADIGLALTNGVIAVGKPLTTIQKLYITQQTGDPLAWYQVQNIGYWLSAVVTSSVTTDGRTEYQIAYTLIYSKSDAVRAINGTHILI